MEESSVQKVLSSGNADEVSRGWIQCADQSSGKKFYYNVESGESQWDPPDDYLFNGPDGDSIDNNSEWDVLDDEEDELTKKPANLLATSSGREIALRKSTETFDPEEPSPPRASLPNKANRTEISAPKLINEAPTFCDDLPDPHFQPRHLRFRWMFCFHTVCCEGPIAVLEALFRFPCYLIGGLFLLLVGIICCRKSILVSALRWLKESILLFAAFLTLLIPCSSALVYRNFSPSHDWQLNPIPTLVGWVDPRRFYVFSLGQGELASNNMLVEKDERSMDSLGTRILHPPKLVSIERVEAKKIEIFSPNLPAR